VNHLARFVVGVNRAASHHFGRLALKVILQG